MTRGGRTTRRRGPTRLDPELVVFVPRVECPRCGDPRYVGTTGAKQRSDGATVRYVKCRGCGVGYRIIEEESDVFS